MVYVPCTELEVIVPVMLVVDSFVVEPGQGLDPVAVMLPLESVPVKLNTVAFPEFPIVPVRVVPVCDKTI